jgi:hypothetical protein
LIIGGISRRFAAVDQADEHQTPEKTGDDVQRGKGHGLRGATEQTAHIGLCEKAAVDHHLDNEQDGEDSDLEDDLSGTGQARGSHDTVMLAKTFAFELRLVETTPQREQLVAADGGLSTEIAHRFGCSLLDGGETLLEAQRRHAFIIGVQVIQVERVRVLLVRFDAFDDLMFDVVQCL